MQRRGFFALVIMSLVSAFLTSQAVAQYGKPKPFAKGVLVKIPTELNPRDMFTLPMQMPGVTSEQFDAQTVPQQDTLSGMSQRVILLRDNVWQHEITIAPLRQARLKIPTGNGGTANKNVWYMLVRFRDTKQTMTFEQVKLNPDFDHISDVLKRDVEVAAEKKKFTPRFSLEGSVLTKDGYKRVVYRDIIDPLIVQQIQVREDPNRPLLDMHQMTKAKIPVAKADSDPGIWGVAVWEEVDPRIDYVSVYVKGITNAFRLAKNVDDPSKLKTLQLNFFRPGDSVNEQDDRVDYGIPLTDDPIKQVLICQRYNLPGPLIRGYIVDQDAKRNVLLLEEDAKVNFKDFQSALTPAMDQGKMPPGIAEAFANAGVNLDKNTALTTIVQGGQWTFKQGNDEYILAYEPQYWERDFKGIRFIKSLDHMWIYR